ncbi:MAG: GTP-binding protein [Clostridiales bacterium]|nr:GTP-binding protein [Clostridiales bacterium]
MVKINIISGFLGAGKTTLIKKLLQAPNEKKGEKIILLENEYGDVGVDGAFMKDSGIIVDELNSGCICCTLVGDFQKAVDELIAKYDPDRLIIEPSGVGKLSEIVSAVNKCKAAHPEMEIAGCATVVDAGKCRMHMKNFGEFFLDQVKTADTIIFSRTQMLSPDRIEKSRALIDEAHPGARVVTTPWDDLSAEVMLEVVESGRPIELHVEHEHHHHDHDEHCDCGCHDHDHEHHHDHDHEHHHHHHEHDEHCDCGCHDHDHEHHHDHDHEHHHHDHDEHCGCHDHEHEHHHDHDHEHHHHEHDEHCTCGCHDHDHEHGHHHHHHADEVFVSIGWETAKRFEQADIQAKLNALTDEEEYGNVLRAKGILQNAAGEWFQFDYVPGESQFREGSADYTGRICVIGAHIDEKALKELWGV